MFDLTILDYIYIGTILVSTVWASIRGGVYETVAMVSWIVAALLSRFVSPFLDTLFQHWFGLTESTVGTLVAAYFIVFFVVLMLFSFFNQKLRDRIQQSMMRVMDHTFGIVFGIIRAVAIMGLIYWGALWYYSDAALPTYVATARTRPVMQLTALKIHDWFFPGDSRILQRDINGKNLTQIDYKNLISPAIKTNDTAEQGTIKDSESVKPNPDQSTESDNITLPHPDDGGYDAAERNSLDNKLLQIEGAE